MPKATRYQFEDLILHEDEHIILVNKPQDMSSLDDKSRQNLHYLSQQYAEGLQLAHRLDKHTSGVLLIAKHPEAYRDLSLQFQHRKVEKEYVAIVGGTPRFEDYLIDLPLLISTNRKVMVHKQDGKPSQTRVTTEEMFRHYSVLRCKPITGRMHQIRVHLAAVNAPIAGDTLYGGADIMLSQIKRKYSFSLRKDERPINHGFLLHAHRISFTHPGTQESVMFEAPFSKNMQTTFKVLRKWDV